MIEPLSLVSTTQHQEASFSEANLDKFLNDPMFFPLHLLREQKRVDEVLARDGFGFTSEHGLTLVRRLPWDSEHFGFSCADLARCYMQAGTSRENTREEMSLLLQRTIKEAQARGIRMLSVRLPVEQWSVLHLLQEQGFRLVDTTVELGCRLPLVPTTPQSGNDVTVRPPHAYDESTLLSIAATYDDTRFHRDPKFTREQAKSLYEQRVMAASRGKHGKLLVVEMNNELAGFATYLSSENNLPVSALGLVVISPKYRGQRLLEPLVQAVAKELTDQAIVVSSTVSNISAQRGFARCGLLPIGARHTLHGWL